MKEVMISPLKDMGQIHPVLQVAHKRNITVEKILELAARGKFSLYINMPKDFDVYLAEISSKFINEKRKFEKITNIDFLALSKHNCQTLLEPIYDSDRITECVFSQALIKKNDQTYATTHKLFSYEKDLISVVTTEQRIPTVAKEEYHFALYADQDLSETARYPAPREIPDGIQTIFDRENLYITDTDIKYLLEAVEINQQEILQEQQAGDAHFGKTTELLCSITSETSLIDGDLNFSDVMPAQHKDDLNKVPDLAHLTSIEQFTFHQNTPKSFKALLNISARIGKALENNTFDNQFLDKQIKLHFPSSSKTRFTVIRSIVLPEFLREKPSEQQKKDTSHITPELRAAFAVSEKCWKNVGVGDESKYPTKAQVMKELQKIGISANKSDTLEGLIRAAKRTTGRPKSTPKK